MTAELVRAALLAYFLAAGYSQPHIDAIDRYVAIESDYDPYIVASTGACLFQWAGSRRRQVMAGYHGCPPLEAQLRFADAELRSYSFNCFLTAGGRSAYATLRHTFGKGNSC